MKFAGKNFNFDLGKKTYIVGILNVTPDSFFDGGKYNSPVNAVNHAKQMLKDGADIIDIGAQSTKPGHINLSPEDELEIVKKYLPLIYNETKAVISVDTFYPVVAEYALNNGAVIVNDVSGVFNPKMAEVVKKHNAGWILMHTGGGDADSVPEYKNGVLTDINHFFEHIVSECENFGISREHLLLDCGIGFGKTHAQNLEIIKNLNMLNKNGVGLFVGLSSKRVIALSTGAEGDDRLFGTISANTVSICGGADFIRVHNVKENVLAAKMTDALIR